MSVCYDCGTHDPKEIERICQDVGAIYVRAMMEGHYDPQRAEEGRRRMEAILREREAREQLEQAQKNPA